MARIALPLGVLALAVLGWLILSPGADRPDDAKTPQAGAAAGHERGPDPLPPLESRDAAAPAPDALDLKTVEAIGPLGLEVRWLGERLQPVDGWQPVDHPPQSWKNAQGTTLTYRVEGDRVVGAQAAFSPTAMSADLAALSPWLVGNQDAIPVRLEVYDAEEAEKPLAGSFETARGVTIYYKATLRHVGDPPYGPELFELSLRPFPGTGAP
ncbi:MAG: hypothetical protein H6706_14860 [Myxococcales bacterium]|nr:hypothetical protein [Myxococcales bacterium]